MKKLLFVLALMFAFTINAQAQDKGAKKPTPQELAKIESQKLAKLLELDETKTADFYRLFELKHQTLAIENLSAERKSEMYRIVDLKIRASLNDEQMKKLESNKELFDDLIK